MAPIVYPSKVDGWLMAVLVFSVVVSVAAGGVMIAAGVPLLILLVLPAGAGLPLWILRTTHYTLDDRELRVRSGPFAWRVALRDVRAVTPTRNPLSSPALSLDRLRIDYGRSKSIMISPEDKQGFVRELERRVEAACATAETRGDAAR